MVLLLLIEDDKSLYFYIKDFNRFMFHKTKNENKKRFQKSCLQCFSEENVLIKHKEDLSLIQFEFNVNNQYNQKKEQLNYKIIPNKQLFPLNFMLILSVIQKVLNVMKVLIQKNIKIMLLVVLLTKLFLLMINLVSQLLFIAVKMLLIN